MGSARVRRTNFQFIPLSEQIITAEAEIGEEVHFAISRDGGKSWTVDGTPELDDNLIRKVAEAYKLRVAHSGH